MTRTILFVDDDDNIINGIKRMLRKERERWQSYYVNSGEKALKLMDNTAIDLIVTDMMMPGMTGEQLLQKVADKFPSTVRMVLSGYADDDALKTAVNVSHQYLTKPCTPELLKEAIAQVFTIQDCISNPVLRDNIGDINQLPSLPRIYQELQQEINTQNSDAHSIAAIISRDMALSAKLLQIVNSPFFGMQRKISNLDEAINIIGTKKLSHLVLNTFMHASFKVKNKQFTRYLDYLTKDSLRTAELAKQISLAEKQQDDRPDQAYLGGLLHNLGLLIFMSKLPEKFEQLIQQVNESDLPVANIEKQIMGFTHSEAGAYVLGLWKIPPRITESILLQTIPSQTDFNGMNALTAVHAAAALLNPPVTPEVGRLFSMNLDFEYLKRINKLDSVAQWEHLAEKLTQQLERRNDS